MKRRSLQENWQRNFYPFPTQKIENTIKCQQVHKTINCLTKHGLVLRNNLFLFYFLYFETSNKLHWGPLSPLSSVDAGWAAGLPSPVCADAAWTAAFGDAASCLPASEGRWDGADSGMRTMTGPPGDASFAPSVEAAQTAEALPPPKHTDSMASMARA